MLKLPLPKRDFPPPLPFKKLLGPSFIILGVGLGSGELILWPYLSANFGLGIIWAALLGITFQFFINMEIERYSLVTGESVFVGAKRKFGMFSPVWFLISTLIPWAWPGIIAASALIFASAFGIEYSKWVGIIFLLFLGGIYSLGRVVYRTQESVQKAIILVGVPFVFIVTFYFAKLSDWGTLLTGLFGKGENYYFLPKGLPIATFLAALAYAGAGGNLNLAQSLYVKEKGYGLAKYAGKLSNLFRKGEDDVKLEGYSFDETPENIKNYKKWWWRINAEHAIVFWFTGALTMIFLSLLSFSTVYGNPGLVSGINFVFMEAQAIAQKTHGLVGTLFLLMVSLMLFGTQFSVYGSTSRINAENLALLLPKKFPTKHMSKYFYFFLLFQILVGITIFSLGFTEPLRLVVIGAVLNAISMFIYSGLILWLNKTSLPKATRPSLLRTIGVLAAFLFYGGFSMFAIYNYFTGMFP
ncbi:MAG: hypothetical protein A2782_03540 [Candidatus Blackburnbacteria bacterium RIFCSPHIGHO2_01_FULL_43_15b]|uniref:Iron transporter n=1 Tax=Candidatus Blackburnbacteria bacterium RIFCSPHIGHO2_01_FULL_43_15b TaxID=1797513 RepID=A0A1G1V044_9BACT|nr:MAG: hypothetical protein A2782_03540 [Candidatus Blackburnbacteria bacterium RIFCSPHIGHO2_01_FULL_43_15b]